MYEQTVTNYIMIKLKRGGGTEKFYHLEGGAKQVSEPQFLIFSILLPPLPLSYYDKGRGGNESFGEIYIVYCIIDNTLNIMALIFIAQVSCLIQVIPYYHL